MCRAGRLPCTVAVWVGKDGSVKVEEAKGPRLPEEMTVRIRSADGTVFWVVSRSPVDYVLHPVFLKFVVVCCLIYALLDQGGDLPQLTGWLFLAAWGQVVVVILLWLGICGGAIRILFRRGMIRQVWTPFLLLPMLILIEMSVQGILHFMAGVQPKSWSKSIADVTRDMLTVLLFDYLHGTFVVALHPQARREEPQPSEAKTGPVPQALPFLPPFAATGDDRPGLTVPAADGRLPSAPEQPAPPPASREKVTIGTQSLVLADILMIRIEDHYLNIVTPSGQSLQRARLSSIEALHRGDLGIQINRSVWVAFRTIVEARQARNGQILLRLADGTEEVVAKPRVFAFRQAFKGTIPGLS